MTEYKSTKATAWFLAATYIEDTLPLKTAGNLDIREHIMHAVVPALKRKAEIIERKHRSKITP